MSNSIRTSIFRELYLEECLCNTHVLLHCVGCRLGILPPASYTTEHLTWGRRQVSSDFCSLEGVGKSWGILFFEHSDIIPPTVPGRAGKVLSLQAQETEEMMKLGFKPSTNYHTSWPLLQAALTYDIILQLELGPLTMSKNTVVIVQSAAQSDKPPQRSTSFWMALIISCHLPLSYPFVLITSSFAFSHPWLHDLTNSQIPLLFIALLTSANTKI